MWLSSCQPYGDPDQPGLSLWMWMRSSVLHQQRAAMMQLNRQAGIQPVLVIQAMGRGNRLLGQINKCGIIKVKYKSRNKRVNSIQTGDLVKVTIPNGKYAGTYSGRAMVRRSGSHDVRCIDGSLVTATKKSVFKVLQRSDGYQYGFEGTIPLGNWIAEAPCQDSWVRFSVFTFRH